MYSPFVQVTANPRDINVLADYKNDPRVVGNLVDGVNRTRDDIHMWLAPFTEGANHFICLTFSQPCAVALLRVWVSRDQLVLVFQYMRLWANRDGKLEVNNGVQFL